MRKTLFVVLCTVGAVVTSYTVGAVIMYTQVSVDAAAPNGSPAGYADYCEQKNGVTIIKGWASDPQAPAGSSPNVTVRVSGQPAKVVSTNIVGYRDAPINTWLKNRGMPSSSIYGWTSSYTGIYKGANPTISGTISNIGIGSDSALLINTKSFIDGDSAKPPFTNNKIPDSCLPYRPVAAITHSPLPAGPFKTPTPTVLIHPDSDSNFTPWLQQQVIPLLKAWYPAVSERIAQSEYTPNTTITLFVDKNFEGAAATWGDVIHMDPDWMKTHMDDLGLLIHESTHIIESYNLGDHPTWISEGIANNVVDYMYKTKATHTYAPNPSETYLSGYGPAAYLFQYIQNTYSSNFVHDLNTTVHRGAYNDSFFVTKTGKTRDALWSEMMGKIVGPSVSVVGNGGKCLDVQTGKFAAGTLVQLWDCNASTAQIWNQFNNINHGSSSLRINNNNYCLDIQNAGTAAGTHVWLWGCHGGPAQQWTARADHTLYNPNSGKCLATVNTGTGNGTQLIIATCNAASPTQRWSLVRILP